MLTKFQKYSIYALLPATIVVDGYTFNILKVTQAYELPEYVSPTIAIQFVDEFGVKYQSIEQGYHEVDSNTFTLTKDYKTILLITVAASDTEPLSKTITYKYNGVIDVGEPYKDIISITPTTPVINEDITITYTRIIRGYDIVCDIFTKIYELSEYEFPVAVTEKSSTRDITELIARQSLCCLQASFNLSSEHTSIHTTTEDNTPIEGVDITCSL